MTMMMPATPTSGAAIGNLSQTADELSAILPPKHSHVLAPHKAIQYAALRNSKAATRQLSMAQDAAHHIHSAEDPSQHIFSREVDEEGAMLLD